MWSVNESFEAVSLRVRVALNTIRLAKLGLIYAINLCDLDALLEKGRGSLLIMRSQSLAVSAPVVKVSRHQSDVKLQNALPWCKELDKDERLGVDDCIKVCGGQVNDIR